MLQPVRVTSTERVNQQEQTNVKSIGKNNGTKKTTANQGQRGAKQRRSKQNYGIRLVKLRALGTLGVKGVVKLACLGAD